MSRYDNLIADIAAVIKNNTTQAITGQVLQDVLVQIVQDIRDWKVEQEDGKGLSANDLTDALLAKLNSAIQPEALATAIADAVADYVAKADIVQGTGTGVDKVMSQKGATDNFVSKAEGDSSELVEASAVQALAARLEALENAYANVVRENIVVNYLNVGKELNMGGNRIVLDENGDITVIGNLHVTGQIINP